MKRKIDRILLVAPVGPYAVGECFLRAFCGLGKDTVLVNHLDYFPIEYGIAARLLRRLRRERIAAAYNRAILDNALDFRPGLLVIAKGNLVPEETLASLRRKLPGTILVNINYDDFFSRAASNRFPAPERVVPLYDWIFPSKSANLEELRRLGAPRVSYLPLGYDETAHYPVRPNRRQAERYGGEVIFAGTYTAERARCLSAVSDFKLAVWGGHWRKSRLSPGLRRAVRKTGNNRIIRSAELSAALNASKIGLNFLREDNRDTHNHRSFELPACGVFTLSQASEELKTFFAEGREMAFFASPEELREKTSYYLARDRERDKVARAGLNRVRMGGHTIRDRVEKMMEIMELE